MIQHIFPIPIYKTKCNFDLAEIETYCRDLFLKSKQAISQAPVSLMQNGATSSACSIDDLHLDPKFRPLTEFYHHHAEIYWKELGYDIKRPPRVRMMWANIYPPGGYIESHDHAPMPLTGAFYVKKPPRSSNIIFEHPLEVILKHQPISDIRDRNKYMHTGEHEVAVEAGELILFPGYLKHKTRPCHDSGDRIIIGGTLDQDYRTRINVRN